MENKQIQEQLNFLSGLIVPIFICLVYIAFLK